MVKETKQKWCDVCGKEMQKDGPIWYGGYVTVVENYATMHSYPREELTKDVCRQCLKGVRAILKMPQFACTPLSPEDQDMVDRAVASMARETLMIGR